jgi:serine/threonine-protein kinase
MTPERWQRVKLLYDAASKLALGERAAFLADACKQDEGLRRDVQTLLDQPVDTASFFDFVGGPPPLAPIGSDDSTSLIGRKLGAYQVEAILGHGGMGDVYRAHDTKLGRDVAIKVLPRAFTTDPARLSRFEQEARVVASLNHPHIAAIHGVEESDGIRGLVLELVEGDTLAERFSRSVGSGRRGLRLEEALDYARQIAAALEAAHEKGITHRDLKPANVKVTPDGVVKLLDFGIAKVVTGDGPGVDLSHALTAANVTVEGLIIGTAGYMSPEQARGKPVDKRTDIWAFGCLLYEMLSGRMAFEGETASDTIAAILERNPDWTTLPDATPPAVRRLLQRCLEKDPKQRLRDVGDARIELEQIVRGAVEDKFAIEPTGGMRRSTLAAVAAAVLALVVAGMFWWARAEDAAPGDRRVSRFTVDLPQGQVMTPAFNSNLALSPDGTYLAFTPLPGPVSIRRLDGLESQPLEVTKSPNFRGAPVFSPDSASISFIEGNSIFSWARPFLKASLSGGAPVKLADYDMFHRGDWGADGWIYWTANYPGGIVRIRDSGGPIEPVTELDVKNGERSHRFADLLPGGEAIIYTVAFDGINSYDDARIDLWDLNTRQKTTLVAGGTSPVYSPSGHIIYARGGKLLAVPFDIGRREVTGSPFEVVDGVMMSRNTGAAHFSLSDRGDLAYVPGATDGGNRTLVWVDRSGNAEPLPLPQASYLYPRLSPDGRSMAVEIEGPNHDFYFYDFARTVLSKVTTDGMSHDPVWTPDGKRLAYRSWQFGGMTMWMMNADRSGRPERLDPSGTRQSPVSFSPDGQFLAFDQKDPQTQDDVWILPVADGSKVQPVSQSRFGEGSAKFSPDGRWIAYSSNESGRPEIYVQPFPRLGPKIQISNAGGTDPVWRRNGGELYYRSRNEMMAVSVDTTGSELYASAPKQLWEVPYSSGSGASCGMPGVSSASYDVTADGQRFLMVRDEGVPDATRIVVVLNFAEEVRAKDRARTQATSVTTRANPPSSSRLSPAAPKGQLAARPLQSSIRERAWQARFQ